MYATRGYHTNSLHIIAHRLNAFDDLLIEVNPRHVRYYERMLGLLSRGWSA